MKDSIVEIEHNNDKRDIMIVVVHLSCHLSKEIISYIKFKLYYE